MRPYPPPTRRERAFLLVGAFAIFLGVTLTFLTGAEGHYLDIILLAGAGAGAVFLALWRKE